MSEIKISIITPSLNSGRFVRETVETIVSQSFKDWEHIVVDGGSTDETMEVLKDYPHIRVIHEADDKGADEAFRRGVREARGQYVMFCAFSDGYLDKKWFGKCVDVLDSQPEISLVWGIDQNMLEDGTLDRIVYNVFFDHPPPSGRDFFFYWIKTKVMFHERDMCVRKGVMEACIPPYDPQPKEPQNLLISFFYNFPAMGYLPFFIPRLAAYGRLHGGSTSERLLANNQQQFCCRKYANDIDSLRAKILTGQVAYSYRDGSGRILETIS